MLTVESTRFSSSVLGLCEPRAMATERGGEKNVCAAWLSSIPLAFNAQTLQSHDKNNIPHLSDGLQGIPVKMEAFSHRSIPHRIETICCRSQNSSKFFCEFAAQAGVTHLWPRRARMGLLRSFLSACAHVSGRCLGLFSGWLGNDAQSLLSIQLAAPELSSQEVRRRYLTLGNAACFNLSLIQL